LNWHLKFPCRILGANFIIILKLVRDKVTNQKSIRFIGDGDFNFYDYRHNLKYIQAY